jgi:hypothetical protein
MLDHQAAVFSRLYNDIALAGMLAEYGEAPAIFEDGQVPYEYEFTSRPIIVVEPPAHQEDRDTFDADMRIELLRLRLYHRPAGASLPIQQAAERVRELVRNWTGDITGGRIINTTVSGPQPAPTDDPSLDGRLLSITLLIKET